MLIEDYVVFMNETKDPCRINHYFLVVGRRALLLWCQRSDFLTRQAKLSSVKKITYCTSCTQLRDKVKLVILLFAVTFFVMSTYSLN